MAEFADISEETAMEMTMSNSQFLFY